jgi:hypothetical protein
MRLVKEINPRSLMTEFTIYAKEGGHVQQVSDLLNTPRFGWKPYWQTDFEQSDSEWYTTYVMPMDLEKDFRADYIKVKRMPR